MAKNSNVGLGKPKFAFTSKANSTEELSAELFAQMSDANQLLANLALALTGECKVSDYQGNKYVARESVNALKNYYYPEG